MSPHYANPQPGASLLLSFTSSPSRSARNTILFLAPTRLTAIRAFAALEAGYTVVVGAAAQEQWDPELAHRQALGQITALDWDLDEHADSGDWDSWLCSVDAQLRRELMLIVLNDTLPLGPPLAIKPPGTTLSTYQRKRRSFASALAFKEVTSDYNYLVNVADAPTLSDFTWPITHRFNLSPDKAFDTAGSDMASSSTPTKSPLQLAITTNSSVCRLAARIKREMVAALPETIGSAVVAVANLRQSLIAQADCLDENDEEGWAEEEPENGSVSLNRPVQQLSTQQANALDHLSANNGRSRAKTTVTEAEVERALSPCRARAYSRSRSRSVGGRSDLVSEASIRSSSRLSTISSAATSLHTVTAAPVWTSAEAQITRMRYVAQISEYWPIDRLAGVTLASLSASASHTPADSRSSSPPPSSSGAPASSSTATPLASATPTGSSSTPIPDLSLPLVSARHAFLADTGLAPPAPGKGRIILLGTGPGSPLLLTRIAYLFLTSPPGSPYHVDLFLCDKLVPQDILALIPTKERRDAVVIARKYPGNAEHAQDELMRLAVEGAAAGKVVMRMKQGDPYLYGRGGEELLHFRAAGFEALVIPGLSSALAGPTICGVPVTQRGVAESMVLCTGVGRGGRDVKVDGYERGKTLVVLMGVARLDALIVSLLQHKDSPYPSHLPIALIERASSPDQRIISSTLENISDVLKGLDAHRPPGMLVVGWGVMCLDGKGDMNILDDDDNLAGDLERVMRWAGPSGFRMKEGLGEEWRKVVG